MLAISLMGILGNYSICKALSQDSPTLLILVSRSEIIIAILLSWIFLKEFVNLRVWITVLIIVFGIIVMKLEALSFNLEDWSSFIWAVSSAFSFASMQVIAKKIIKEINPQLLNVLVKQDEAAKFVAKKLGVPEELIRSPEEMQQAAQQFQEMQQMAQQQSGGNQGEPQ